MSATGMAIAGILFVAVWTIANTLPRAVKAMLPPQAYEGEREHESEPDFSRRK